MKKSYLHFCNSQLDSPVIDSKIITAPNQTVAILFYRSAGHFTIVDTTGFSKILDIGIKSNDFGTISKKSKKTYLTIG
jgi:hypothetical protein